MHGSTREICRFRVGRVKVDARNYSIVAVSVSAADKGVKRGGLGNRAARGRAAERGGLGNRAAQGKGIGGTRISDFGFLDAAGRETGRTRRDPRWVSQPTALDNDGATIWISDLPPRGTAVRTPELLVLRIGLDLCEPFLSGRQGRERELADQRARGFAPGVGLEAAALRKVVTRLLHTGELALQFHEGVAILRSVPLNEAKDVWHWSGPFGESSVR